MEARFGHLIRPANAKQIQVEKRRRWQPDMRKSGGKALPA
jgi:hypothetical protein